jgi:SMODS-associated and fused to various effectors sensor domain/TIR domain
MTSSARCSRCPDVARPVFLSYAWDDAGEVDELDTLLRLRGVPVWRDRRDMQFGGYNEELVCRAIEDDTSGFALYLTPAAVENSWFIPKVELRAMDRRRSRDDTFFSGAIFRGYSVQAGKQAVFEETGIDIGATLGAPVDEAQLLDGLRDAANAILRAYIASDWTDGPARIRIETRDPIAVLEESLVHLAFAPPLEHDPERYDISIWDEKIQPALADLQQALHTVQGGRPACERVLEVSGAAHLSAALALGYQFREPTRWQLRLHHFGDIWETGRERASLEGWEVPSPRPGSDPKGDLVVMVHASADVTNAARATAGGPARAELHFRPPGGPDRRAIDPRAANAAARGIANTIRDARARYAPAQTRLYIACPWPFAALLGWHLASVGAVVMHEATVERDSYRVSCVLR